MFWQKHITLKRIALFYCRGFLGDKSKFTSGYNEVTRMSNANSCSISAALPSTLGSLKSVFKVFRRKQSLGALVSAAHFVYLDILCQKRQGVSIGYEVFLV